MLDSLFLLNKHGDQIKRRRSQQQEMLQGKSGVGGRNVRKTVPGPEGPAATEKNAITAMAPDAPNMPNRMAAQNRNGTGA